MLVLNLPFKALMFLTLMRPSLVLFLVLWLKLVKDFLKVRCRLALLPFLISCLIWLDLVASLPLIKERILVIILLLRSEERFSRNAETDLVCRLLLEQKKDDYRREIRQIVLPYALFRSMFMSFFVFFCLILPPLRSTLFPYTTLFRSKLVKDFLKVRCRLALLPFLISCLIWLDLVASLPLIKERILVIILLL